MITFTQSLDTVKVQVEIWDRIYAKKYRFKRKLYSNPCKSNNWMMKVNNVPEGRSLEKKKKKESEDLVSSSCTRKAIFWATVRHWVSLALPGRQHSLRRQQLRA